MAEIETNLYGVPAKVIILEIQVKPVR